MLAELFKIVTERATQAAKPRVFTLPGEPNHVYGVANDDGTWDRFDAQPEPRGHEAYDLDTIAKWAMQAENIETTVAVWYSRNGVTLLLDDETRRDSVKLTLEFSPQFMTVQALERAAPLDQKKFIRLLRIDLAGCLESPTLLEAARSVKFSLLKDAEGEVRHGQESVGKTLKASLASSGTFPERVDLSIPIFAGHAHRRRYLIPCAVELDVAEERFKLTPFPGVIEDAICQAEEDLGQRLAEALTAAGCTADVNYGTP